MRVLHLPVNTASIASTTVRALRTAGVEAHGIVFHASPIQSVAGLQAIPVGDRRHAAHILLSMARMAWALAQYVRQYGRPDVIHWYYSDAPARLGLDRLVLKMLSAPGVVEWTGADIRIPDVEFAENPYYKRAWENGYEYRRVESRERSLIRQRRMGQLGLASVAATGMLQYVQRDLFPRVYQLEQRLILEEYEPVYPDQNRRAPRVLHIPSAPVAKGTSAVLKAVEALRSRCDFDFLLTAPGTPRSQVLVWMAEADIILDQFVLGDRGILSLEAMALGKPVVCYLKPSLTSAYPPDLPIINATQDTLATVLEPVLRSGALRSELGRRGRSFMEQHHDARRVIPELIEIYREVQDRHIGLKAAFKTIAP